MSPELRKALGQAQERVCDYGDAYSLGQLDAILRYAECNPTIPDRALCQCWGDVIKAAIPAALWDRVSKETA